LDLRPTFLAPEGFFCAGFLAILNVFVSWNDAGRRRRARTSADFAKSTHAFFVHNLRVMTRQME